MISEFGIIPDVFDPGAYSSPEVCDLRLGALNEVLLSRGLVRNLAGGKWWDHFQSQQSRWHSRGKELMRKLKDQGRLTQSPSCSPDEPGTAAEWCDEAIASNKLCAMQGVIADDATAALKRGESAVASISKLTQAEWWPKDGCSVELKRRTEEYLRHLRPILSHSNSLMFIDPHLDPSLPRYQGFCEILRAIGENSRKPPIELHRVVFSGGGQLDRAACHRMFQEDFSAVVKEAKLQVEVFVWDKFHDRYLISNLIGLMIPNGYDEDGKITRWSRLDRKDSDSVQREFDPASGQHNLHHRFRL